MPSVLSFPGISFIDIQGPSENEWESIEHQILITNESR